MSDDTSEVRVDQFNDWVYSGDPADYLSTRLQLLMLAGSKSAEIARLAAPEISWEGLTLGAPAEDRGVDDAGSSNFDAAALDRFLTTDLVLLHHHAAETVLRLYIGHASHPQVPAVDIASRRRFDRFKEVVRTSFVDGCPADEELAFVFLGRTERPDDIDEGVWRAVMDGYAAWLRAMALTFLDEAEAYNAIKHGLAVAAGGAEVYVGSTALGHGPSITFPVSSEWADGRRTWSLATRWVRRGEVVTHVHVAVLMVTTIWRVGKARTTRSDDAEGVVFWPHSFTPADVRRALPPATGPGRRWTMTYLEERSAP
jgi:hypothetical protein